jgi:hypothetical protein
MPVRILFVSFLLSTSAWATSGFGWNPCNPIPNKASCTIPNQNGSHVVLIHGSRLNAQSETYSSTHGESPTVLNTVTWTGSGGPYAEDIVCFPTGTNVGSETYSMSPDNGTNDFLFAIEITLNTYASCAAAFDNGGTGSGIGSASSASGGTLATSAASSTVSGDLMFVGANAFGTVTPGSGAINVPFTAKSAGASTWFSFVLGGAGSYTGSNGGVVTGPQAILMVLIKPGTGETYPQIRNWTASQSMSSGTGGTLNLPQGIQSNDYILCAAAPETRPAYATSGFSALSGWTNLLANGGFGVWGQVWSSGTATPTITAAQNNGFYEGMCVAYGGVNTSTPVDMVNDFWCQSLNSQDCPNLQVPPVFPTWTTDMLVAFDAQTSNASDAPVPPANMNNRFSQTGSGPWIAGADVNLTSASPTATSTYVFTHLNPGATNGRHSAGILLMPASGGSSATRQTQPTEEANSIFNGGGNCSTTTLYPVVGDVVVCEFFGTGGTCTSIASGYTAVYNTNDMLLATHTWLNTDTTGSVGGFGCPGGQANSYIIHNALSPATSPQVFASGTTTHASTTSDASPSIATITNSFLLVQYSAGNSGTAINGTFTMPGGLFTDSTWTASSQITTGAAELQAPANPSTSFTATNSVSGTQNSGAVDFCIVCSTGGYSVGSVF